MNRTRFFVAASTAKIVFGAAALNVYLRQNPACDYANFAARWAQGCFFTDDWKTDGFVCLTLPLWTLGGGNLYVVGAMLGLLAITGAWAGALALKTFGRWTNAQTAAAAAALIFTPSAWLWTALPGKETLIFAAVGGTLYGWSQIYRGRRWTGWAAVVLCMAAVVWVRPYLAAALGLTFPFLLLTRKPQTALWALPAAALVLFIALWRFPLAYTYVFEYAALNRYYALQNWGTTAFDIGLFVPDFAGVAAKLPAALAAAFLRPYPHEPYPPFLWPMKIEAAWFAATLVVFRPKIWAWPVVLFALAYGAFVGLSTPHFGTLWRHKTYFLPWLWALAATQAQPVVYSFLRRKRNDDSSPGR